MVQQSRTGSRCTICRCSQTTGDHNPEFAAYIYTLVVILDWTNHMDFLRVLLALAKYLHKPARETTKKVKIGSLLAQRSTTDRDVI